MKAVIFATEDYQEVGRRMSLLMDCPMGELEQYRFPDGEPYIRICTDVLDREVVLIGGSHTDTTTLQSFDLGCGFVNEGARRLSLVLPYFGCSTMERSVKPGEVVTAKNRARLFSAIPRAPYGNRIFSVDLHTGGLPHYFEGGVQVFHVYAKREVMEAAKKLGGEDFVLGSTDSGRAKWVESLANDLGVSASFVYKRRLSGSQTQVTAVSAHVEGKAVVIYDDMIRTGGSLIGAARAYRDLGATDVAAVATHGIFPGNALERIHSSGLISKIVCTDSHPNARQQSALFPGYLELIGLEEVLCRSLRSKPE
jgi:ribose-phosphate pyrophosphokinase